MTYKSKILNSGYFYIAPWVLGFLLFTLGPLVFSLVMSFHDWPVSGKPSFIGTENYVNMIAYDPDFKQSFMVTLKFAMIFVPYNIGLALILALLLNHLKTGAGIFKTIFYLPSVISGVALVMIWSWVYNNEYGILNYMLSLIGIEGPNWLQAPRWAIMAIVISSLWGLGGTMLIFLMGLKAVPKDLYESAILMGANGLQRFWHITLPMITPVLLFNIITSIIAAFQQLTIALLLTKGGPLKSTYFFAMYVYDNAFKHGDMGYAAAGSWIMFLIVVTLTMIVFKSSSAWVFYESEVKK